MKIEELKSLQAQYGYDDMPLGDFANRLRKKYGSIDNVKQALKYITLPSQVSPTEVEPTRPTLPAFPPDPRQLGANVRERVGGAVSNYLNGLKRQSEGFAGLIDNSSALNTPEGRETAMSALNYSPASMGMMVSPKNLVKPMGQFSSLIGKKELSSERLLRQEISDADAMLKVPMSEWKDLQKALGRNLTYGDVLMHDELFSYYPKLAEKPIILGKAKLRRGTSYPDVTKIHPDAIERSNKDPLLVLLHEAQHDIQRANQWATGRGNYRKRPQEIEARDTELRQKLSPNERLSTMPYTKALGKEIIPVNDTAFFLSEGISPSEIGKVNPNAWTENYFPLNSIKTQQPMGLLDKRMSDYYKYANE